MPLLNSSEIRRIDRKVPAKISTSQVKIVWPKKSSSGRPAAARGSARKATMSEK